MIENNQVGEGGNTAIAEVVIPNEQIQTKNLDGLVIKRHCTRDADSKDEAQNKMWGWQHAKYTPERWVKQLSFGHTIIVGEFDKKLDGKYTHAEEYWKATHMIFADADNLTPDPQATDAAIPPWIEQDGLVKRFPALLDKAYAIYESVSSMSEEKPYRRYRAIFLFDEPITSGEDFRKIELLLAAEFPVIPAIERHPAQPTFGNARKETREGKIYGNVLSLEAYLEYESPEPEPLPLPVEPRPQKRSTTKDITLDEFIRQYHVATLKARPKGGYFVECPFKDKHASGVNTETDAYIWENADGSFAFYCSHTTCKQSGANHWSMFRESVAPVRHKPKPPPVQEAPPDVDPPPKHQALLKQKKAVAQDVFPTFPKDMFFGGFYDLYDAYLGQGNYYIDQPFVMAMGLAAVGVLSGRRRCIRAYDGGEMLFPNLYTILTGKSKYAAKSSARKQTMRLIQDADSRVDSNIVDMESLGSRQALLAELETEGYVDELEGKVGILHFDEMKSMFDGMRRDYASDLQSTLIRLWDCPERPIKNHAKSNPIEAWYPVMNIFGCTTKSWMLASMQRDDLDGGFMNRFITFYTDGLCKRVSKPRIHLNAYQRFVNKLTGLLDTPLDNRAKGYTLSEEAFARYDYWCDELYEAGMDDETKVGTSREEIQALKIALSLHLMTDRDNTFVGFDVIETAIAIASYTAKVGEYLYSNVVSSEFAKLEQRILEVLNSNNNSMPAKAIQQKLKHHGYKQIGDLIASMIQGGFLHISTDSGNVEVTL